MWPTLQGHIEVEYTTINDAPNDRWRSRQGVRSRGLASPGVFLWSLLIQIKHAEELPVPTVHRDPLTNCSHA